MKLLPRFLGGLIPWSHQILWWNFSHDCWWERSKFHIGDVLKEQGSCCFLPPQTWLRALDLTRLSQNQKHLDFNQLILMHAEVWEPLHCTVLYLLVFLIPSMGFDTRQTGTPLSFINVYIYYCTNSSLNPALTTWFPLSMSYALININVGIQFFCCCWHTSKNVFMYLSVAALQSCVRFCWAASESAMCVHTSPSFWASLSSPHPASGEVSTEHQAELPTLYSR